jgi:tetratricopeptide (TPR) repeat protein
LDSIATDGEAISTTAQSAVSPWLGLLSDHELVLGALLGALVVLIGAALLWYVRRRRPAQPTGPDADLQKLVAKGELERAADLYLERQNLSRAIALYERAGAKPKLARAHVLAKQPGKAARIYAELGRHAEAAHYFEAASLFREAGDSLLVLGDERAAAELLERGGEVERAARIHARLGDPESASRLFARAGLGIEAADALLEARGRKPRALLRAAELYESAGEWERTAGCLLDAGEPRRAAEIFERLGRFSRAAESYERAGVYERAADCHEKAGQITLARAAYERAGDRMRAAELALEEGKNLEAGRAFYEVGSYERAIDTLQRIPPTSPDATLAARLLARIFLEKGLIDRARERLRTLVAAGAPDKEDLELLMMLATALERLGDGTGALEVLEQVAGVDPQYPEVETSLERVRERAYGSSGQTQPGVEQSRYELRDEIGRGGMGIVRLAWDRELERPVAIKFLPHEYVSNPEALRLFRAEARAAAAMNHPNIVHIYDVAVLEGEPCIVMEYVQGRTVREVMRVRGSSEKQPLSPRRVGEIGREICRALAYAHRQNVIHRDVKPSNMLLAADGTVKLMDFGISKVMETGDEARSEAKGTPQYMPPEQILGREIDGRTDLYALGISLFEIATAQRPFTGDAVVDQQLHAVLPDPRRIRPEIPEGLVKILQRACQKDSDDRYASAHEMAQALELFLGELAEAG